MLCSKEDIFRRISLGYAAYNKYQKARNNRIPLNKRLLLNGPLVVSVLMRNSSWRAAPKLVVKKLDIAHRHHIWSILNNKYTHDISNKNLYKGCNAERVVHSRWRMLGHVLRGPKDGPACIVWLHQIFSHWYNRTCVLKFLLNDLNNSKYLTLIG